MQEKLNTMSNHPSDHTMGEAIKLALQCPRDAMEFRFAFGLVHAMDIKDRYEETNNNTSRDFLSHK